jgi:hypothetical protein
VVVDEAGVGEAVSELSSVRGWVRGPGSGWEGVGG